MNGQTKNNSSEAMSGDRVVSVNRVPDGGSTPTLILQSPRVDMVVPAIFLGYAVILTAFFGFQSVYCSTSMDVSNRLLGFSLVGVVEPIAFGMLVNLGIWLASKFQAFHRRRGLRWRCLAVACTLLLAPLATRVFDLGRTWTDLLRVVAVMTAVGLLWFALRLNGRRFILPALFGIGFPVAAWLAIAVSLAWYQRGKEADWSRFDESMMRSEIETRAANQPVQTSVPTTDPNTVLASLASAQQSYFQTHGSVYASSERDLLSAGFARGTFVDPGTAIRLHFTINLPRLAPLPADVIVASILDRDEIAYTVLFGDWHTRHVAVTDWPDIAQKSNAALRDVRPDRR